MAVGFKPFKGRSRSVGIKIQGLKELNASFKRLSDKSDSFTTREIHRAADRVARRANRDVPVDTGKLLRSIKVTKGRKQATIDVEANYAGYVELGTKFMRKQPYFFKHLQPSIDVMIKNIKRLITL